ncbi:2Fe-2S iron-sulfur cluster-binding protein [Xanthobacter tagetidis]|jgi:2Fe-2S ferredoxin|uniref:2Fe-2S ferredoxin n=1 Tax=Xanthobacter tagetidis TaxID=60216 RepID=A0A3L7A6F9_9HYPH|nr:2Fe-2S iron-sulfur cluster-binding protein [Xanthobacter tagetidis]MBB6310047.1 2Fe-2S ferredoxin [Xanthobacter tagetidis]RLP75151.1 2Fe-2S ferredoxin [Xanthobacter tagetidis]
MTRLIVTAGDGTRHEVEAADGLSLMEALRPLDIGIAGECEGSAACASCHVWVADAWIARLPEPEDAEADMLDCAFNTRAGSRLSCQLRVGPELEGLEVTVPHA